MEEHAITRIKAVHTFKLLYNSLYFLTRIICKNIHFSTVVSILLSMSLVMGVLFCDTYKGASPFITQKQVLFT